MAVVVKISLEIGERPIGVNDLMLDIFTFPQASFITLDALFPRRMDPASTDFWLLLRPSSKLLPNIRDSVICRKEGAAGKQSVPSTQSSNVESGNVG